MIDVTADAHVAPTWLRFYWENHQWEAYDINTMRLGTHVAARRWIPIGRDEKKPEVKFFNLATVRKLVRGGAVYE